MNPIIQSSERRLLARVVSRARTELSWSPIGGWHHPGTGARVDVTTVYAHGHPYSDRDMVVAIDVTRGRLDRSTRIIVGSVIEAVDVLAALSVLPSDMSSMHRAGWMAGYRAALNSLAPGSRATVHAEVVMS